MTESVRLNKRKKLIRKHCTKKVEMFISFKLNKSKVSFWKCIIKSKGRADAEKLYGKGNSGAIRMRANIINVAYYLRLIYIQNLLNNKKKISSVYFHV